MSHGKAHTSGMPLKSASVATGQQPVYCTYAITGFPQIYFYFSHQLTDGLFLNTTKYPDHFRNLINSSLIHNLFPKLHESATKTFLGHPAKRQTGLKHYHGHVVSAVIKTWSQEFAVICRAPPSPPTDNIWAVVIVWRVRGEIIWPALCCCAS